MSRQTRIARGGGAVEAPRLALSAAEAARAIGTSEDYFNRHVRPELRVVRRGRKVLIAVSELEHWLDRAAAFTLEGDA